MANDTKERIGIVGTGRMGLAMLKHLVKRGYTVTACDVSAKALETARAAGGATADTPPALAKQCDFVILGVGYTDEINAVVYGDDGLIANLAKGSIIAVSSTTSPATVQQIAQDAGPKGIGVLDAPICRGCFAADEGTLLALVGGTPDVVERGRTIYGSFCSDYAHLGDVGHGQVGKTMNNLLLWISAVGLIEAGRLAETDGGKFVPLASGLNAKRPSPGVDRHVRAVCSLVRRFCKFSARSGKPRAKMIDRRRQPMAAWIPRRRRPSSSTSAW